MRSPRSQRSVVDTTGAGDAYCGGFLVALGNGLPVAEAGARAAVSASFAIEQFGVPMFDEEARQSGAPLGLGERTNRPSRRRNFIGARGVVLCRHGAQHPVILGSGGRVMVWESVSAAAACSGDTSA